MVNNHAKGLRVMRKARHYWESRGGLVYQVVHGRYGHKDVFGLFDQLVLIDGKLLLIQIKANQQDVVKKHLAFYNSYLKHTKKVCIVLMTWIDRRGWKILWLPHNHGINTENEIE